MVDINQKIEENMGLVGSQVNKFNPDPATRQRLLQAGRIALWKAIETHDPEKGKLATWAHRPIFWGILAEYNQIKAERASPDVLFEPSYSMPSGLWEVTPNDLTPQEEDVLSLRAQGSTFREISDALDMSASRASMYLRSAIEKIQEANNEET